MIKINAHTGNNYYTSVLKYAQNCYLSPLAHLVDKIGYEKDEGENAGDQGTGSDVGGLTARSVTDRGIPGRPPVPVCSLDNAVEGMISKQKN